MLSKIGIGAALLSLILIFTACGGATPTAAPVPTTIPSPAPAPAPNPGPVPLVAPKPRPPGPIEATWLQVVVDKARQTVSLPISELEDNWNVHFKLETTEGETNFMAYIFKGDIYVRANVCPPCRSIGFSLDEESQLLICDRCATLFDAGTGAGIEGACVDYPKAEVPYEIGEGNIVMQLTDLSAAYHDTLTPG
jgi:nitrite reductase/ring-hydroxylating ferredoxin subunit